MINNQTKVDLTVNVGTCFLPLLWASSCDAELTATLQSEQYRRRRAFSSSVSGSVSASGSTSGSGSGSAGDWSSAGFSSTPAAEVVSWDVAATAFWAAGEEAGASVGAVGVDVNPSGCAGRGTGDSGRGAAPGTTSVELII